MLSRFKILLFLTTCACSNLSFASESFSAFDIALQTTDAQRFVGLFNQHQGQLMAAQLQQGYLQDAGRGVEVFTPQRIESAENLANAIAKRREDYRYAIDTCMPLINELNAELRSVYLALHGLLPERALPSIHVVFGAGNSGGTAAADAQVIGLEVACKKGTSVADFRQFMRMMFAHETVHSWQGGDEQVWLQDPLLFQALGEGAADYVAGLVLGRAPDIERDRWASAQRAHLFQQFWTDRAVVRQQATQSQDRTTDAGKRFYRWFANYGNAPEGWHYEAGYWIGRQIISAYMANAGDKLQALTELLAMKDPAAVLKLSGLENRH